MVKKLIYNFFVGGKNLIRRMIFDFGDGMVEEYPTTAYVLTLIGAVISLIIGMIYAFVGSAIIVGVSEAAPFGLVCIILGLLGAILGFVAASMMKNPEKVHTGGILAIIAAFFSVGGMITFILLLIGGIMALTWKKPEEKATILPPPPPA